MAQIVGLQDINDRVHDFVYVRLTSVDQTPVEVLNPRRYFVNDFHGFVGFYNEFVRTDSEFSVGAVVQFVQLIVLVFGVNVTQLDPGSGLAVTVAQGIHALHVAVGIVVLAAECISVLDLRMPR